MMSGVIGRIHSYESFGTLDGPGVRYVVFLQGCPLRCRYCHNPDTWNCAGGRQVDSDDLLREIAGYRIFISPGGVTLPGGEPLMQPAFSLAMLEGCRALGLHTAVDTAGSLPLEVSRPLLDAADLILLDIKALENDLAMELTGQGNANELATLRYCEETGKPVWIRHVLVPGWTMRQDRLEALADFLKPFRCVEKVELLPYHRMGEFKWKELDIPTMLDGVEEPSAAEIASVRELFRSRGLTLK